MKSIISLWTPQTKWENSLNRFYRKGDTDGPKNMQWCSSSCWWNTRKWSHSLPVGGAKSKSLTVPNVGKKGELKLLFIVSGSSVTPSEKSLLFLMLFSIQIKSHSEISTWKCSLKNNYNIDSLKSFCAKVTRIDFIL